MILSAQNLNFSKFLFDLAEIFTVNTLDTITYNLGQISPKKCLENFLKNDFVERAVFLNARNANKLWRVFKEQTKERSFIFKACFYF